MIHSQLMWMTFVQSIGNTYKSMFPKKAAEIDKIVGETLDKMRDLGKPKKPHIRLHCAINGMLRIWWCDMYTHRGGALIGRTFNWYTASAAIRDCEFELTHA